MAVSTPESRVRRAKRVVRLAQANARFVSSDESQARSTRTRSAYKIKAVALDEVERILSGRKK